MVSRLAESVSDNSIQVLVGPSINLKELASQS